MPDLPPETLGRPLNSTSPTPRPSIRQGDLWVADLNNADIEEVTQAGNRTSSLTYEYASGSNKHPFPNVVGVAVDGSDNLYVLTTTTLYKFDDVAVSFPNLNLLFEISLSSFSSAPASAITVVNDAKTNIYISFTNGLFGTIVRIPQPYAGSFSTVVGSYSFAPAGLSVREDGQLAVSDTLGDGIYVVNTNSSSTPVLVTGGLGAGFVNGAPGFAKFNQPRGIAASADGHMVVCDTMNNYMRLIDASGNTTTLYGTSSNVWTATCCSCNPALYAGWVDGTAGTLTTSASGRQPVSVTIAPNGTLFVTESYYNLIRAATGSGLTPVTSINSGGSSTNTPGTVTTLSGHRHHGLWRDVERVGGSQRTGDHGLFRVRHQYLLWQQHGLDFSVHQPGRHQCGVGTADRLASEHGHSLPSGGDQQRGHQLRR